jgi:AraC-like DNA-binding protein
MLNSDTKTERASSKVKRISPDDLEDYKCRRITSAALAEKTGMNASYLRRAIKREPLQPKVRKSPLIAARNEYRLSISHLPPAQIATQAHVSVRTAQRIKAKAAKLLVVQVPVSEVGNNNDS